MSEHTPGPWRASGQEILSGKGLSVVCIGTVFHSPGIMEPGEREANAAFIVKACNGHKDALMLARILAGKMYNERVGRTAVQIAWDILDREEKSERRQ